MTSYKQKLAATVGFDDDVFVEDEDDKDYPNICLTREEKSKLRMPWIQSHIIKLLGKLIGYNYLHKKLKSMWNLKAHFDMIALENDYFLVRFASAIEYAYAKQQEPWKILDHYLVVKEWYPNFDPSTDKTVSLLVWVRFPKLPIEYFNYNFLEKVGKKMGRPIRADMNTSTGSRGRYARILVEVDITKPLLFKYKLKNKVRPIEYGGIHLVCFQCGVYGHRKEACPTSITGQEQAGEDDQSGVAEAGTRIGERVVGTPNQTGKMSTAYRPKVTKGYGSWMLAKKKERQHARRFSSRNQNSRPCMHSNPDRVDRNEGNINRGINGQSNGLGRNSRFSVLEGFDE
ncbi:uncharacterized protein LOC115996090 [Ipomoea triloba]|uniref:uncharacterized protein LOC115996090 n=1 Tax=Ipomoea triloba TaxID=35885 RepID=UPI00125E343E|nr:uncharacterized protein LOC115996090 [Ipomoea triloba]